MAQQRAVGAAVSATCGILGFFGTRAAIGHSANQQREKAAQPRSASSQTAEAARPNQPVNPSAPSPAKAASGKPHCTNARENPPYYNPYCAAAYTERS
ncbi:hypothetical protein P389DRAFT_193785 [Cystobasidium minutum MCA 4210]|uniref:uncharacterized protein n=1 Tax=Cystobasidium minutum MCA 4210 TaxID=1397322 RepID=UPI0034CDAD3A|eukprot:jgi/Rhomi1/193785/gm1.1999_g